MDKNSKPNKKKELKVKDVIVKDKDLMLFHPGMDKESLKRSIINCLRYEESKDFDSAVAEDYLLSLAWSIKHRLVDRWIETQKHYHKADVKQVFYLSLEYLTGQAMKKNMVNLCIYDACTKALKDLGFSLDDITELEQDAALGNGGLGRLAACYLDSMATIGLPAHGYGLRYEYGIFKQIIDKGWQVEQPDNWLKQGSIWEIKRPEHVYKVQFGGKVVEKVHDDGRVSLDWIETKDVLAEAYDTPYIGYNNNTVNTLRLWSAEPTESFNLEFFNRGDYLEAVEQAAISKSITRVLYPSDANEKGLELRLHQEYFLVSASLQDIIHHFKHNNKDFKNFPEKVAVQLNDTHPSMAIPELMRIFIDHEGMTWENAWTVVQNTFAYTNHTVLPEALERWPVEVLERILPRHLQIIYDINSHFLRAAANYHQNDKELLRRISIIEEHGTVKRVNMAHLSIVASHRVNGVSELHTNILKKDLFKDFDDLFPGKIINKTNGITPRRWLKQCNYPLSKLIDKTIGKNWLCDLYELKNLLLYIEDKAFLDQWRDIKHKNKEKPTQYIKDKMGLTIYPDMMFDVQIKRIHQYKRQLMNALHIVALYIDIKKHPKKKHTPRAIIFGGKSAPSYTTAKLIIKLINSISEVVNHDPDLDKVLKVVFIPDYKVSIAEKIIPATDLSEQISTAGLEASGTGNMKFALNGALTIGTLDGANIEMKEEIGEENMFIFGMTSDQVEELKKNGYDPKAFYKENKMLQEVIELISNGHFNLEEPDLFKPLMENLLTTDPFCLLADFKAYIECQQKVSKAYLDKETWTKKSILNSANMGKFSSDRAIREYADEIWGVKPFKIPNIKYDSGTKKHSGLFK